MYGFSGHLENRIGSGTDMYRSEPAFRKSIDALSALLAPSASLEIAEVFADPTCESATRLAGQYFGPHRYQAMFQIGLIDLWSARGLRPGAAIGICLGEYVGAYAAGILDQPAVARSLDAGFRHFEAARSPGVFWLVEATSDQLAPMLADAPMTMHLIAMLAPREAVVGCAEADGGRGRGHLRRFARVISEYRDADLAWHTPMATEAGAAFERELADVSRRPAACPLYAASLAGGCIDRGVVPDARFFAEVAQRSSAFDACVAAAIDDGHRLILTVGSPRIGQLVADSLEAQQRTTLRVIDTFQRREPAPDGFARAGRELRSAGVLR